MSLHLDIETFSECELKKAGVYRYSEDETTEVLCLVYAFDDEVPHLWLPHDQLDVPPSVVEGIQHVEYGVLPERLVEYIKSGGEVRAHNAQFERTVLNGVAGQKIGFPRLEINQMVCTAAKAAVYGLPRALGEGAAALGTYAKDSAGHGVMLQTSKPRSGKKKRYDFTDAPEKYRSLYLYNIDDVLAERDLDHHIPELTPAEQEVWRLDQRINDRGMKADLARIDDAMVLVEECKAELAERCLKITGAKPTQTQLIAEWCRTNGYPQLPDLQAPTILEAVRSDDCPENVKEILRLRATYAMKAPAKLQAMKAAVCKDGRLRGMYLFYGAGPGRWSSMIVQMQNLPRPMIKDPNTAIDAFAYRDLDLVKMLYSIDPMKVIASCIRGMLIPDEGCDILSADFSSVEAKIVAWISGQEDVLEIFRTHGKIYEYTASKIYNIPMESIKDGSPERLVGKVAALSLGYQGGVKALQKMGRNYDVDIPDELAATTVAEYRRANFKIKACWYDLQNAAIAAVKYPGTVQAIPNRRVMFKCDMPTEHNRRWLHLRLPSGRQIHYYSPKIETEGKMVRDWEGNICYEPDGSLLVESREALTYMGIDTDTRQWMRVRTYGGRIMQNIGEGVGRDFTVNGLQQLEKGDYPPIGSVHDEAIAEPRANHGSLKEALELMCTPQKWAEGLPLKAAGFRARRYGK